jgi:hypothetical protein
MKKIPLFTAAFLAASLTACGNNNFQKPMNESHQIGYYEDQNRNTRINTSTSLEEKDYAKWGKLALQKTKEKYPDSRISDYEYDTRLINPDGTIVDYFDFTVYQDHTRRLVKVGIAHTEEDKLIDIKFEESA